MLFADFRHALLELLRARVRNGELTERALAKLAGISQPHTHNVLKGVRTLSPELMDTLLYHLRLSLLDLVDRSELIQCLDEESGKKENQSWLPVVDGRLGPGNPWPLEVTVQQRFPVSDEVIRRMWHPVVAVLAADSRMHPVFSEGDVAILNQSHAARTEIEPDGLYVVKRGPVGILRRIRLSARAVYLVTEDSLDRQSLWERLPAEGHQITHFVRARAMLVARGLEWPT